MNKKFNIVMTILLMSLFVILFSCYEETKPATNPKPTALPDSMLAPGAGLVWLTPEESNVAKGADFEIQIHTNTGNQKLAAYGFLLSYNQEIVAPNLQKGTFSVDPLPEGYVQAVNSTVKGTLKIAGFDVYGKGPKQDLGLIKVSLKALKSGMSPLTLQVENLTDDKSQPLGKPGAKGGNVTVK
jgi:hypothetical protein